MKRHSLADALRIRVNNWRKQLKRMKFRLKAKIFLIVILPGMAALLALETLRTFLRISLRKSASQVGLDGQPTEAPSGASDSASGQASGSHVTASGQASGSHVTAAGQTSGASDPGARVPVQLETFSPDFITPRPVKSEVVWPRGQRTPRLMPSRSK